MIKVKNVWIHVAALSHSRYFSLYFSCCCPVSWDCCCCAVVIRTILACRLVSGCSLLRWGYVHDICHVNDRTGTSVVHSACKWQAWWGSHNSVDGVSLLSICYPMPLFWDCSVLKMEALGIFLNVLLLFTRWHDLVSHRTLTVWRQTSYCTANLQTLHFIYLFNKCRYWIF